jgi:serine/threonine-protein kinase RsbW
MTTMEAPDVRLTMPARPEGVAVVRQALAGMADALDFDAAVLSDMKMAVSEACTNVVVHAYDDTDGTLEVDMRADDAGLSIQVRDHGTGIKPRADRSRDVPALGLGLPLIAALSDAFELRGSAGHGTEVRMKFNYARDGDPVEENPVQGSVGDYGRWDSDATRETPAGG